MSAPRQTTPQVLDLLRRPDAPPAVVVTGTAGVGRSRVLGEVGRSLRDEGRTVIELRIGREGGVVARHGDAIAPGALRRVVELTDGAGAGPAAANRAADALAACLVSEDVVLLVDDGQWLDWGTAAVLEAVAARLAGTAVRVVCAVALPFPPAHAGPALALLRRLRAAGLVSTLRVPALDAAGTARVVREIVGAVPSPDLVADVRARSRGVAAAVAEAVTRSRRSGAIRDVGGYAHLVPGVPDEPVDGVEPSVGDVVRGLGDEVRRTAAAAAALAPAGRALARLLAVASERTEADALRLLEVLRTAGVLHRGRDGGWRFLVPLVGDRLRAALGPYERRRLAALLVTAVWSGEVDLDGADLADQVAAAGRLLPAERAHAELVAAGFRGFGEAPHRAVRWWRAAAEVAATDGDRARAREMLCTACTLAGDAAGAVAATRSLLTDGSELTADVRDALIVMLPSNLHKAGETEELALAAEGTAPWQDGKATGAITRALALGLTGDWARGHRLLGGTRGLWATTPTTRTAGEYYQWIGELFAGRHDRFEAALIEGRAGEPEDDVRRRIRFDGAVGAHVALGDVRGVRDLARRYGLAVDDLHPAHRAVVALLDGTPGGADTARRVIVDAAPAALDTGREVLHLTLGVHTVFAGRLTDARALMAAARDEAPLLEHLLAVPESMIDDALGDPGSATARLESALAAARRNDLLVGTDVLLGHLVGIHRRRGDPDRARVLAAELEQVASVLLSPRAAMYAEFARALADDDSHAASACLELAHENGQAFEVAHLGLRLNEAQLLDPGTLVDVYERFGRTGDALLARSWARTTMEQRGIPVPGRAVTKSENERLLGQLLTQGLSNRQIATLLGSSEKSVEGRLGRLFARTGYRSRIELATALLDGSYVH